MGVAQLAVFLVVAAMFIPAVRQSLISVGFYVVAAVLLVGVVAIGVFLVRRTERKPPFASMHFATVEAPPRPTSPNPFTKPQEVRPSAPLALIQELRAIDWFQFEKLVALVYRKLGYTVTRHGGANADGGIDLVIEKDGQRSAVQCKQWKTWNVGVKAVREFLGALTHARIQRGIFITLCGYSGEAKQLAGQHGIEIINEAGLAQMLESSEAKFDPETLSILHDPRKFCPKCESEMVVRTARKGLGAGNQFWGCSTFPRCRFKMSL